MKRRMVIMVALLMFPVFSGCVKRPGPEPAYDNIDLPPGDDGSGLIGAE